jgi:hypothetical protein
MGSLWKSGLLCTFPQVPTLVEDRAFVGAICRGRACTRDKWGGHVAPNPVEAFVAGRIMTRDKRGRIMPIYIDKQPATPHLIFSLVVKVEVCMLAHFFLHVHKRCAMECL